ncbi:MAG: maleylpyruvate isomerase family mycothiol-dependent enzyme [Acidimicrobiales bacterium]
MDAAQAQMFTEAVERDGARLLEVAEVDLMASVPACPDWDVARLVVHVGQVHGYIAGVLENPSLDPPTHRFERPDTDDIISWAGDARARLVAALGVTDPATPTWSWGEDHTAAFFHRRMAAETLVHRIDVEDAVDRPSPIDGDLATDAVDEFIDVGLRFSTNPDKAFAYPEGSLHLHRTDGPGEWLLRNEGGTLVATREHAKGDAAVRGSGGDLLRFMWNRPGAEVEILGDAEVATAWRSLSA